MKTGRDDKIKKSLKMYLLVFSPPYGLYLKDTLMVDVLHNP